MADARRPGPRAVLLGRQHGRSQLIERARRYATSLDPSLGVRAVVVFGSVARGDFNLWSDLDILVLAENLPEDPFERHQLVLRSATEPVSVLAWSPADWAAKLSHHDPIAVEATEIGVTVAGHLPPPR